MPARRRKFRKAFDRRPDEAVSTLSYLSVLLPNSNLLSSTTGGKPRVSTAFSQEATHTSSKEKLGCYLPEHGEFSDTICVASSRLRLNQYKLPPATPGLHWASLYLTLAALAGFSKKNTAENTVPMGAQPGLRTTTHLTCRSTEN